MVVTSSPSFLRIVVRNGLAFVLHRSSGETGQLGLFFEGTLGGFGFENLLVLFAVLGVLQTEQSVQAREQFFE